MKTVLGIDTALSKATVAIICGERVYECSESGYAHQWLLGQLDKLLMRANLTIHQIDLIGVSIGPGSFSGLRVGLAIAKALSLTLDIKLVPISTLLALAYRVKEYAHDTICTLVDAKRQQVYAAIYDKNLTPLLSECIICADELLKLVRPHTLFTTDTTTLYQNITAVADISPPLKEKISTCLFLDDTDLISVAAAVSHLARQNIGTAHAEPSLLTPTYLRPPPITASSLQ